jgi:hypothetical protein
MLQGICLFSNCGSAFRKKWDAWLRDTPNAKKHADSVGPFLPGVIKWAQASSPVAELQAR